MGNELFVNVSEELDVALAPYGKAAEFARANNLKESRISEWRSGATPPDQYASAIALAIGQPEDLVVRSLKRQRDLRRAEQAERRASGLRRAIATDADDSGK